MVRICYPAIDGVVPEETFVYNTRNQMTQHTDVRGTVTLYTYDANGMPATKKIGSKNAIAYSYQSGLLKSQTDAMGNTTRYAHNTIGQVTSDNVGTKVSAGKEETPDTDYYYFAIVETGAEYSRVLATTNP